MEKALDSDPRAMREYPNTMKPQELERIMKRLGFKNSESFAEWFEVHPATVYRWRNGDVVIPDKPARLIRMLAREKGAA